MGLLLKHNFIDAKTESSSFSMHSVFHDWCFHAPQEIKAVMSRPALMIIGSAAPSNNMPYYSRLLPHCDRKFSLAQQRMQGTSIDGPDLQLQSNAYHGLGNLYAVQGRMKEAEGLHLRQLARKEKAWGAEHTSTLEAVNNPGALYSNESDIKEAEDFYLRALEWKKPWVLSPHQHSTQ